MYYNFAQSSISKYHNIPIIGEEEPSNCEVPSDWIITEADQEVLQLKLPAYLEDVNPKDVCIWVDPLDGTAEYTQGLVEHVTVLVGVAIGKTAVGGVIHQSYCKNDENSTYIENGHTLWGINGAGFGGFTPKSPLEGKRIITTTRLHFDSIVQNAIKSLDPDEMMCVGGAGHKVILLLEGKAHAYVFASRGCKRWDTCAPEAVLYAIGGVLTDLHGERYSYNQETTYVNMRGILATAPGQSHQLYLSRIHYLIMIAMHLCMHLVCRLRGRNCSVENIRIEVCNRTPKHLSHYHLDKEACLLDIYPVLI